MTRVRAGRRPSRSAPAAVLSVPLGRLPQNPGVCPGVSKPGVTLAWKESELFHRNFWSSQGGFP